MGIRTSDEHSGIVVRLEDNRVGLTGIFNGLVSHPAGVGHQEESYSRPLDVVAYGLGGIVRNHKMADKRKFLFGNITAQLNSDRAFFRKDATVIRDVILCECVMRESLVEHSRGIYRLLDMLAVRPEMTDVVQMVVSDQHGLE